MNAAQAKSILKSAGYKANVKSCSCYGQNYIQICFKDETTVVKSDESKLQTLFAGLSVNVHCVNQATIELN
jgi:hypothetical protein